MRLPTTLLRLAAGAAIAAGATLAAAPAAKGHDYANQLPSMRQFPVASHTTQTFRMNIDRLHENANSLLPCAGFEVHGPGGLDIVAAEMTPTGYVAEEWAKIDDEQGGRIGVERRPDGTFYIGRPQPLTESNIRYGLHCASVGWRIFTPRGTLTLDEWRHPNPKTMGERAAREGRARADRLRAAMSKLRRTKTGRRTPAWKLGPVEVLRAESHVAVLGEEPDILVTLRTGAIPPGTVLTLRALVIAQQGPSLAQHGPTQAQPTAP